MAQPEVKDVLRAYLPCEFAKLCGERMVRARLQVGMIDKRDPLAQALGKVADAANYTAMEILKNGECEVKRRIFSALCEAFRGMVLLTKRKDAI